MAHATIKAAASLALVLATTACQTNQDRQKSTCAPVDYDQASMHGLLQQEFASLDQASRQALALDLTRCLSDPDPVWRDDIAYNSYVTLLRNGLLDAAGIQRLSRVLFDILDQPDTQGFAHPFAVLTLAEVARADRLQPFFSAAQRQTLLERASGYLTTVSDYRGFSEIEGWRHGIAHAADLLLQLSLNSALNQQQLQTIMQAVGTQIAPPGTHFYHHGEAGRLARPILYIALRNEISEAQWQAWFNQLAQPEPFANWREVYRSQAGLAKLHNTKAFAQEIYVNASASSQSELTVLAQASLNLLKALP